MIKEFLFVKSLMGLPIKWIFFLRKNKLRCGSDLRKISKSKIASVRLKIFLIDLLSNTRIFVSQNSYGFTAKPSANLNQFFVFVRESPFLPGRGSEEWMNEWIEKVALNLLKIKYLMVLSIYFYRMKPFCNCQKSSGLTIVINWRKLSCSVSFMSSFGYIFVN